MSPPRNFVQRIVHYEHPCLQPKPKDPPMNCRNFFAAANDLSTWLGNLRRHTKAALIEAEDRLCLEHQPFAGPSLDADIALILAGIQERLEEVTAAVDRLF